MSRIIPWKGWMMYGAWLVLRFGRGAPSWLIHRAQQVSLFVQVSDGFSIHDVMCSSFRLLKFLWT